MESLKSLLLGGLLPILIVLAGVGGYVAMGKSQPKQIAQDDSAEAESMRLPIVTVAKGHRLDESATLDLDVNGVVVPFRQVLIAAEVAGRIIYKSESCRIGRYVNEGELLFELDPTDYQNEVDRWSAQRESEYAQQKELDQEVANAQRMLELTEQEVALQEKELKRLEKLPAGFASATELDQARRGLLAASNQRLIVQNQLEMQASRRTRVLLAERLAATQLAMANVNLARTKIKAPISGVIVAEMAEQASFIQKGASLCSIDDTRQVEVSVNLRTDQLLLILDQKNMEDVKSDTIAGKHSESYELPSTPVTVEYRVAGREESVYQWSGTISRYEGIGLDAKSRTVPVRIVVDSPRDVKMNGKTFEGSAFIGPQALVQGMFVDCRIHTRPRRSLILVPKLALRPGNQVWEIVKEDSNDVAVELDENSGKESNTWTRGKVRVLNGIRPIRTVRWPHHDSQEYWVADARDDLSEATLYIVSPVAGFIGDGSDQARFQAP